MYDEAIERDDYLDDVGVVDAEDRVAPPSARWRLLDDVELMQVPDPAFLVADVLPDGAVGALVSPPGLGKTTLAADLAFSLATTTPWHGHTVLRPGSTIYAAAEDPGGFKMRLRARKEAGRVSLETRLGIYTFPDTLDMRDLAQVADFSDFLGRAFESGDPPRRLLVIDTYAASNPGLAENSSEDTTAAMASAARWRDDLGLTVMLIHHTNASGTRERGHSAMRGACDFMLTMTENDDVVELACTKMRNAAAFKTLKLRMLPTPTGDGMIFRLASDVLPTAGLSPAQAKAFAVLVDTFPRSEGASKTEWQRSCPDIAERTFHRVCGVLVDKGLVEKRGTHYLERRGAK